MTKASSIRWKQLGVACALAAWLGHGQAAVTAEEAAKLKTTLTPLGGERAGNADGSIPAWTGGYSTVPPGYKSGEARPDPYAADKPLYSITAGNMDKYADKISDGQKAMLKKYDKYRVDVYPSHRSMAAPQYIYDGTFKNATTAHLEKAGMEIKDYAPGTPFPIPKSALEVLWNHFFHWKGDAFFLDMNVYVTSGNGKVSLASHTTVETDVFHNRKTGNQGEYFWGLSALTMDPPFRSGEQIMILYGTDFTGHGGGTQAWQYFAGQRRVRRAPSAAFDTPNFVESGQSMFDEINMFSGSPEKYDWKLVGKKEMVIPYNNNKVTLVKNEELIGPYFANPDHVRHELHRVWVLEGTLASGKRHAAPKIRVYVDEDNWAAVLVDKWDAKGQLWRFLEQLQLVMPEFPGTMQMTQFTYDLLSGTYAAAQVPVNGKNISKAPQHDMSFWSPEALAGRGTR